MELHPRPRFYALIWGQLIGIFIILAGMFSYWLKVDNSDLPPNITWRVIGIIFLLFLSFIIPQFFNSGALKSIARNDASASEPIANNAETVRYLLWWYAYGNLILTTYLVHITGGIIGSMFAGLYLMLPSIPLLLKGDSSDLRKIGWYIFFCCIAIGSSFLMSHLGYIEYNASKYPHAYDIAITAVTISAISIPLVELIILRYKEME